MQGGTESQLVLFEMLDSERGYQEQYFQLTNNELPLILKFPEVFSGGRHH
jgi:hypothetical protein